MAASIPEYSIYCTILSVHFNWSCIIKCVEYKLFCEINWLGCMLVFIRQNLSSFLLMMCCNIVYNRCYHCKDFSYIVKLLIWRIINSGVDLFFCGKWRPPRSRIPWRVFMSGIFIMKQQKLCYMKNSHRFVIISYIWLSKLSNRFFMCTGWLLKTNFSYNELHNVKPKVDDPIACLALNYWSIFHGKDHLESLFLISY